MQQKQLSLPYFDVIPKQHDFYELMTKVLTAKCLISQFADLFSLAASFLHIREAWVKEVGVVISDKLWMKDLDRIKACAINARLQLIQFKVIHWLDFSKTKLNRIFPCLSV